MYGLETINAINAPRPQLFRAKVGTTLYIYDDGNKDKVVDQILRKIRRTGESAKFPFATVWFAREPIVDTSKSGSAQYTWAKDGNRVKCLVVKHVVRGIIHETTECGTVYADLD